jgi:hypothetical protein
VFNWREVGSTTICFSICESFKHSSLHLTQGCVYLCSHFPCTFDKWVPILDFYFQGFSSSYLVMSNTDGFGDRNYVFLLHSYINICPWLHNHFCTLLWSMQASPFSYNELNTSNTKIIQNKKPKFLHNKLCIHTIIL